MRRPPVVVVGGGPAGSVTALLLARSGQDVTLLEKRRLPRDKACAEFLSPGGVEVLERLGLLPSFRGIPLARPGGIRIVTPRTSAVLRYGGGADRRAMSIRRLLLDAALLEAAAAAGVKIREGERATDPVLEGDRVAGVRTVQGRRERTLRASFVVIADGLRSPLGVGLGGGRIPWWPRRIGLVTHYSGTQLRDDAEMHVGRGAYCGIADVGGGAAVIGLVLPMQAARGSPAADLLSRGIASLPGIASHLRGAERVSPVLGVGPLAMSVPRTSGPGYLLVGDAAGFLDPFTGEGLHRALAGAEIAAAAVGRALARADAVPEGYAAARRAAFAQKEAFCRRLQWVLAWRGGFDRVLRAIAARPALEARMAATLGDYGMPLSPRDPAILAALAGFAQSLPRRSAE